MNRIDRERAAFWRHPSFPGVDFLEASFTHHRYDLHTHPGYVVGVITRGVEQFRVGRRRHVAPSGSILVVNPEEPHDGEPGAAGGWAYRTLYPPVAVMAGLIGDAGHPRVPVFAETVIWDPPLAQRLAHAHRMSAADDPIDAEAWLITALRDLIARHGARRYDGADPRRPACGRRLARYRALIEANLAARLDLAALGRAADVTRFQVIRDFRRLTGLTPGAYIRVERVQAARRLIDRGVPLAEAAIAAGFADQSHLTRVFRAIQGITPRTYMAAARGEPSRADGGGGGAAGPDAPLP